MSDRYRKKPVEVEARQVVDECVVFSIADWCGGSVRVTPRETLIRIRTLEGVMEARVGDWIIKGVMGEFYPCKPDIFDETYEPVEDQPDE